MIVVDNDSSDGTGDFIRERYPGVELIALAENRAAAARTVGVRAAATPFVAFSDDDSWWDHDALIKAADAFDTHPKLALVAARVLVGAARTIDPICAVMAASPLPADENLPGPSILGFLACGAAVRRTAFLNVGGFEPRFLVGGEKSCSCLTWPPPAGGLSIAKT